MTVDIVYETEESLPFPEGEILHAVIQETLREEGCPFDIQVCVTFTGDEGIRQRNRDFRGMDSVTDVLSFPLVPFPEPSDFRYPEEEGASDCFDPDTGELCLGDIVVCIPQAARQAEEYGHSLRRETAFLVAHSMLHLLGYDHMTEAEAAVMEEKQERILRTLGITREQG